MAESKANLTEAKKAVWAEKGWRYVTGKEIEGEDIAWTPFREEGIYKEMKKKYVIDISEIEGKDLPNQ